MPLGAKLMSNLLAPRGSHLVESEDNHVGWARLERFRYGNGVTADL